MSSFSSDLGKGVRPEGTDTRGVPLRIIVVDDHLITRRLIVQAVKSAGYKVVAEAEDGRAAVELFTSLKPDIITLDIKMPIMDGFEALKAIRKIDPEAKVVMLTNEKHEDIVTAILKAGANGYIVKPVNRERVLKKLRAARGLPP